MFLGDTPTEVARFCGSGTRPVYSVDSNILRVLFTSDFSINDAGFLVTYSIGIQES